VTKEQLELIEDDAQSYLRHIAEGGRSFFETPYHSGVLKVVAEIRKLRIALSNIADLYDSDERCRSLPQYIEARKLTNHSSIPSA
jgi:hypothetical protein